MPVSLDDLINSSLSQIIETGGAPLEDALYQRQAQAEREGTFSRGLGISSVTRDALAKARTDAALAAQSAQLSALGQAAGVTQGNLNRTQQESQFGRSLNQQNKALGQQKDIANQRMLGRNLEQGAGALAGLAGASFGPEIRGGLRGAVGLPPLRQDAANGVPGGQMPGATPTAMPTFSDPGAGSGGGGPSLDALTGGDFSLPTTAFSSQDFSVPDYSFAGDFSSLDLGSLYDLSFNPYRWGDDF